MNLPLYDKKWHGPILRYFSKIYFRDTGEWFTQDGPQKLDSAIMQASERLANFCPNDAMAKYGRKMLIGLANVRTYVKLQEIKGGKDPEVSSILNRMDRQEVENMYRICHAVKNLPLVCGAVRQYHVGKEQENLDKLILEVSRSFDVQLFKHLNKEIIEACKRINLKDRTRHASFSLEAPLYDHSYIAFREISTFMDYLEHSMRT